MIRKNYVIAVMVLAIFLLPTPEITAGDSQTDRGSLKGLQGVYVLIEDVGADLQEVGITQDVLRTDVELKLRMAGIKVLSKEEGSRSRDGATLYISLNALKDKGTDFFIYDIGVSLIQNVILIGNFENYTGAETWSLNLLGLVPASRISYIREKIKDLTDRFVNAYLSVNPKK